MTYEKLINEFISTHRLNIPFPTSHFAGSQAISRISNGQNRKTSYWHRDNTTLEAQLKLRTLSWVGKLLNWHIDHIRPVSKGGSYNVANLRLLPRSLNSMIGNSGDWNHEKLNRFVKHMGPEWRGAMGIPDYFKSCGVMEFLKLVELNPDKPAYSRLFPGKTLENLTYEEFKTEEAAIDAEKAKRNAAKRFARREKTQQDRNEHELRLREMARTTTASWVASWVQSEIARIDKLNSRVKG
jgi:hypothetical protein